MNECKFVRVCVCVCVCVCLCSKLESEMSGSGIKELTFYLELFFNYLNCYSI
jgi:hypothetical protein